MFGLVVDLDEAAARDVRGGPGVLSVEPDRPVHSAGSQVSPPWGLDRIDQRTRPLDGAYQVTASGVGVTAYVIDSGLWLSHDEFVGRVADGAFWTSVTDRGRGGTTSSVVAGIDWVNKHHVTGDPAVANLSLGGDASPGIDAVRAL